MSSELGVITIVHSDVNNRLGKKKIKLHGKENKQKVVIKTTLFRTKPKRLWNGVFQACTGYHKQVIRVPRTPARLTTAIPGI